MHVQNEELPKELKHVCFKNHRKTVKINKKPEAETAIDQMQEAKVRQILRKVTFQDVRALQKGKS